MYHVVQAYFPVCFIRNTSCPLFLFQYVCHNISLKISLTLLFCYVIDPVSVLGLSVICSLFSYNFYIFYKHLFEIHFYLGIFKSVYDSINTVVMSNMKV